MYKKDYYKITRSPIMNYITHSSKNNNARIYSLYIVLAIILISCETSSLSELAAIENEEETIDIVTYENRAQAILDSACVECHNINNAEADVRLDTFDFAFTEADNGRMLARMIDTSNPMPPSGNLPDNIIEDIANWIDNGILEN